MPWLIAIRMCKTAAGRYTIDLIGVDGGTPTLTGNLPRVVISSANAPSRRRSCSGTKSCSKPLVQIADAKLKSFNRSLDYGGPEHF